MGKQMTPSEKRRAGPGEGTDLLYVCLSAYIVGRVQGNIDWVQGSFKLTRWAALPKREKCVQLRKESVQRSAKAERGGFTLLSKRLGGGRVGNGRRGVPPGGKRAGEYKKICTERAYQVGVEVARSRQKGKRVGLAREPHIWRERR